MAQRPLTSALSPEYRGEGVRGTADCAVGGFQFFLSPGTTQMFR